jgi:SAM-dependent methyltransferase
LRLSENSELSFFAALRIRFKFEETDSSVASLLQNDILRYSHKGDRVTQEIFDQIAPEWYNLRHRTIFRMELEALARRWRRGKLLNVGCAHGPDFPPFVPDFELYGVDFSAQMLELAREYAAKYKFSVNLTQADARRLPFADDFFDYAIAVATYHHIEDNEGRLQALKELKRVLKPGGEAFITVWNKWQPRFWLKKKDILVPWKSGDKVLNRYYHLFSYGELEKMVCKAGFEVLKSFAENRYKLPIKTFSRNICVVVKKG